MCVGVNRNLVLVNSNIHGYIHPPPPLPPGLEIGRWNIFTLPHCMFEQVDDPCDITREHTYNRKKSTGSEEAIYTNQPNRNIFDMC